MIISKRAKVTSDKPAYKEKIKTDNGYVWRYTDEHVEKRWKEKKEKLKKLEKELDKVRKKYKEDLKSDDDRTRAIAAIVGIMDETAMRIGNEESAREGTYGASTLKVKHVKGGKGKMTFDFPGKGAVEQNVTLENNELIKVIRDLMKGKKADDFIFEIDGKKIWDRAVNRYLKSFDISAKDLRGFHANRLMKEMLKKKDFKEALDEVAEIVGHKASTLKNQYLDPELVEEHEDKKKEAFLSIHAKKGYEQLQQTEIGGPELVSEPATPELDPDLGPMSMFPSPYQNVSNIQTQTTPKGFENVKISPHVAQAWKVVAPFLPRGSELSSGFRSEWDQIFTIRNKWSRYEDYFNTVFPGRGQNWKDQWKVMVREYPQMYYAGKAPKGGPHPKSVLVDWPGKSEHQSDKAFDISGPDLQGIGKALGWLNQNLSPYMQFSYNVKPDHVHVQIDKIDNVEPLIMREALNSYWEGERLDPQLFVSQSLSPMLSKRAFDRGDLRYFTSKMQEFFGQVTREVGGLLGLSKRDKQNLNISPGAKVNSTILGAWKLLQPYLPPTARMTSGARTPEDQLRIIERAWRRYNAAAEYPNVTDPARKARILTKEYGYVVGPPDAAQRAGDRPMHLKGTSFDISGANLYDIEDAVRRVSRDPRIPVKLTALVEDENNAVHVNIHNLGATATSDPDYMMKKALFEDLMESDAPEEILIAFDPEEDADQRGKGLPDMPGDWFEKSPMFRGREETPDYEIHDVKESEASKLAKEDPETFFYRGLHKDHPDLEAEALKNMLDDNAKFYFIFEYHEREEDEFRDLLQDAAEKLSQQDVRAFFYFHLHHHFPELGRGAIVQLIDTNPDSFFDLGLDKDYPDYTESAGNARNIKDPNKIELEQPEWLIPDDEMELSIRDKNASKKKKDKPKAGVFAVLPSKLAKQFPSLGEHDDSKTHITVLFIGAVPEDKYETLEGIVKDVSAGWEPFEVKLDDKPTYFPATKHSDGCKIAKMAVVSNDLKKFHKALKKAISEAGLDIDDHFPDYKPHVTLEYMDPPKEKYDGDTPTGSWKIEEVEIWGCGDNRKIKLGGRAKKAFLSKRAAEVTYLTGIPPEVYEELQSLPGVYAESLNNLVSGEFEINEDLEAKVRWSFYDASDITKKLRSYGVTVILTYADPERRPELKGTSFGVINETLLNHQSLDPHEALRELKEFLGHAKERAEQIVKEKTEIPENVIPLFRKEESLIISKRADGLGPIAPMKLRKMEDPDAMLKDYDDSDIIVQQKIDGFKTQAIKDKAGSVKLYTRRGEGFEANVPNLVSELEDKMNNGDFWLGELAYLKDGKQSISDVQTIVGSNPEKAKEKLEEGKGQLVFYVYDLLWNKGDNIIKRPYEERYSKLAQKVGKSKLIHMVENYSWSEMDKAIEEALKAGGEGVVLKPKDSEYKYAPKGSNEPVGEWAKHKPAGKKANKDEVILKEYSKGKEKLVFPMYQYKDGELFEVGQLSGMSKEDEAKIKKDIDAGKQVVVEITFQERMESGKLRHAGWSRFRPDKPAKEVKFSKASRILNISKRAMTLSSWVNRKTGEAIDAGFMQHLEFVQKNARLFGLEDEEADDITSLSTTQKIFSDWMRVFGFGPELSVDVMNLKDGDIYALQDFIMNKNLRPQHLFINNCPSEFSGCQSIEASFNDFMTAGRVRDLTRFASRLPSLSKRAKEEDGSKYEKEKGDPKWQQVLIDEDRKWTRKQIRDHYLKNADKILKEIKGDPVMLYVNTGKTNQNVLKRKHDDKPIVLNNKDDLEYWADRRLLSIHRVFGAETDLGFVDLDVHEGFSQEKTLKYAREIASKIKSKYGSKPTIYDSGGTGYHVEFHLKSKIKTDTLRNELREMCEDLNEKHDGFTTGIVKGKGVRTDVTTLKNNGNIRVPYALHEKYGGVKRPVGSGGDDARDGLFLSRRAWDDQLPGGLADEKNPSEFDQKVLMKGIHIELEHTDDILTATEIAMDHLTEDPEYYEKLEKVEKHSSLGLSKRAKDPLSTYKKKRDFDDTPEPEGKTEGKNKYRFVIQRHKAERAGEHFDLRLENDEGTLSSWAIPKHKLPSGNEKLLATKTEDHPIDYMKFKGEIPEGEYGAGHMTIHDSGTYEEIEKSNNKMIFKLKGKKEKGTYTMVKTDGKKWLIMVSKEENNG